MKSAIRACMFVSLVLIGTTAAAHAGESDAAVPVARQHRSVQASFGLPTILSRHEPSGTEEVFKIVSLLGERGADSRLVEKVRLKLESAGPERLKTLASLSDRARYGSDADRSVAYLILAAMVVFS